MPQLFTRRKMTGPQVRKLFGDISDMTLWRWLHDDKLGFPKPMYINGRRYWDEEEIEAWQHSGVLERVDMVFSRDQPERLYVQHRLLQRHDEVRDWVARDAAIYVCGSLQGMASGVDAALRQIVGETVMGELLSSGRYRRDVY